MERLTYDFCVGDKHCWQVKGADNLECKEVCRNQGENGCTDCPIAKAFDRLAAYEDTGLEPEELAQAKKKGRLVVLPCDVGDKLYDVTLGEVREKIVVSLSMFVPESVNHLVIHAEDFRTAITSYELQDIGETFFLTREAAEAALEEREVDHDR